jgi:gas vesicle protein
MMEQSGNKKGGAGNFVVGMLVGMAVGAGVSMLYAPKSGAETRAMLRERAHKIGESASNSYNKVKSRISEMRGRAEEKAEEMQSKANM